MRSPFKKSFAKGGNMDRIPEDKILKYHPDTLIFMRKTYNLDKPGQMDQAIDVLDAWVKKQSHLVKKDFSREYLERIIILLKGSVERAKSQIEKLCTLRTLLPQFFDKFDAINDFKDKKKYAHVTLMPKLTEDHQRVYFMRLEPAQYSPKVFLQMYFYNVMVCEYLKAHDYSNGLFVIADFRKLNSIVDFATQINLFEMKQMDTITLKGYGTRVKKFVLISTSNAIELVIKILKQMLPDKLGQRIYVVRDLEELYKHISKELLPSDYGGNEKPLETICDEFEQALASKENIEYLKEMSKARTNEAMRTTTKINDDFLGIEGTFRTLNFD